MQNEPKRPVTDKERDEFWQTGVVCLRDMFDVAWIERMQGAVDDAIANPGPMHLKLDQG